MLIKFINFTPELLSHKLIDILVLTLNICQHAHPEFIENLLELLVLRFSVLDDNIVLVFQFFVQTVRLCDSVFNGALLLRNLLEVLVDVNVLHSGVNLRFGVGSK